MKEYVYKGQVYPSISKLSQATGVDACYLSKKLKKFPETEEGNEVDPLIDEILSKRNRTYQYNGVFYETAKDAARDLGIKYKALTNYLTKTDYDLEKAVELYEENREVFVIDGVEYPSKIDIARSLDNMK